MSLKRKSPARPDSWQRVRHFEYMIPLPIDETLRLLRTPTDYYKDVWLVLATVKFEPESAEVTRMAFYTGKQLMFEGYLKALPDGTTLVSGKAAAHILPQQPQAPMSPEEEAEAKAMGCGYLVLTVLVIVGALLFGGVAQALTIVGGVVCLALFLAVTLITWSAIEGRRMWRAALRQRDDILIALEKRLGIDAELTK